jgi:predicted ATP-grasp superfamily ATP-dependent carboligase
VFWEDLLLENPPRGVRGSILLPCSDPAIEFMATHWDALSGAYVLDDHIPAQQLRLLDKEATYKQAREAGVPAPKHWRIEALEDLDAVEGEVLFPVLIKPTHSHRFQAFYDRKFHLAEDLRELRFWIRETLDLGLDVMVCEMIPGPDSLLSSYYTYITSEGDRLFDFTKRILRRSPPKMGRASYHITEWLPHTAELGKRFFQAMDFRGLGNVEFKHDPRDGRLKLIECNARFTAAQELLVKSGMDISWIIYLHLTGQDPPTTRAYKEYVRYWYFLDDVDSLRDLRRQGDLSILGWLWSVARPQVFPFFSLVDPAPAFAKGVHTFRSRVLKKPTVAHR